MNVEGNLRIRQLSEKLDFPYKQNGSLVLCFEEEGIGKLEELKERGEKNGVEGLEIITGERIWEMEPNLSRQVKAMLYAPTGGIVPWQPTTTPLGNSTLGAKPSMVWKAVPPWLLLVARNFLTISPL